MSRRRATAASLTTLLALFACTLPNAPKPSGVGVQAAASPAGSKPWPILTHSKPPTSEPATGSLGTQTPPPSQPTQGGRVRGVVTESGVDYALTQASDKPVGDALVYLDDAPSVRTRSAADGSFELIGVAPGDHFIVAEKTTDGGTFKVRTPLTLAPEAQVIDVKSLVLKRTGSIQGLVKLAGGQSALGADIFIAGSTLISKAKENGAYALTNVAEGAYDVTAKIDDFEHQTRRVEVKAGKPSSLDFQLELEATPPPPAVNRPPAIKSLTLTPPTGLKPGAVVSLAVEATDPEGDPLAFEWSADGGTVQATNLAQATWTLPQSAGTYNIYVNAVDNQGGKSEFSRAIAISADGDVVVEKPVPQNRPPIIERLDTTPESATVDPEGNVTMSVITSDPDGDAVTVTWSATGGTLTSAAGSQIGWKAPSQAGSQTVLATASDGRGTSQVSRMILVRQPAPTPGPTPPPSTPTPAPLASSPIPSVAPSQLTPTATPSIPAPSPTPAASTTEVLTGTQVSDLKFDTAGNAWVVGANKLVKIDAARAVANKYTIPGMDGAECIDLDSTGAIWVAAGTTGVFKLTQQGTVSASYQTSISAKGLVVDDADNIWVTNTSYSKLLKLDSTCTVKGTYTTGTNPRRPCIDGSGNIWVPNYYSNNVMKFSSSGTLLGTYAVGKWPNSIAFDASGNAWVVNSGANSVTKLAADGTNVGEYDVGWQPEDIVFDSEGYLWVTGGMSDDVSQVALNGDIVKTIRVSGYHPFGIDLDTNGAIWAANNGSGPNLGRLNKVK